MEIILNRDDLKQMLMSSIDKCKDEVFSNKIRDINSNVDHLFIKINELNKVMDNINNINQLTIKLDDVVLL